MQASQRFLRALVALVVLLAAPLAKAAPETHILRIDPRAAVVSGTPLLTTIVEVVQFNALSRVMAPCGSVSGFNQTIDCISSELEKPSAVWSPMPFPAANARLLVKVEGADTLASLEGTVERWGDAVKRNEKGFGTAWLITLDASSGMGSRYAEGRAIARQFIEAMAPADHMRLMIFDDRLVLHDSNWKTFPQRNDLVGVLNAQPSTAPSRGRDRPLFDLLKKMTADAFGSIGNTQGPQDIPLHQAMVVLSNGASRNDAAGVSATAALFRQFATKGRFPDDNQSVPKTPLPIISVWMPNAGGLVNDVFRNNDQQFMQELANPEIGGLFSIVREGQGEAKGRKIIELVRARFNSMYVAKWRLSCLNPTVSQSFQLEFSNVQPPIKGDATFQNVPIGVDPTQWPLDIDQARTKAEADANPVYPGGTMKIYGQFCWGGDAKRAEAYFVPAGTQPDPNFSSSDIAAIRRVQQNLIAQNMRGGAKEVNDSFAVFEVPDEERLLEGSGDATVTRVLVYDNGARRASGRDAQTILTLKSRKKPFNLLLILGIAGAVIVIILLFLVLLRGGGGGGKGKRSKSGGGQPLAPVVAGGAPPYGGGAPPGYGGPPAGGYGAPPPGGAPPYGGGGGGYGAAPVAIAAPPAPAVADAVVQVRCSKCGSMTMATAGQSSVCFSCGQPLGAEGGGGSATPPMFPLTGGMPAQPVPPANPYGGPGVMSISHAILSGGVGDFTIPRGQEVRVGRDPAMCPVMLPEPRISGVHATLKIDGAHLWVRDETSNNGTFVGGNRIPPGIWTPVPPPGPVRFGPVEFSVRLT